MPRNAPVLAFAIGVLLAGCVTTTTMPTYVVRFTLTNTGTETLEFSEYPHCGTAEVRSRHVLVQAPRPSGKALAVMLPGFAPTEGPGFVVTGMEGMARGLGSGETLVPDGVRGTDTPIVRLALQDGRLLVNGVAHDLPYSGTSAHPDGLWSATYTIEEGPQRVHTDHRSYTCA